MSDPGPEARPNSADRWLQRLAAATLLIVALSILVFQLSLARTRTFDPDEFQHAHSAYLISQGQVPYWDYFEHHPPLLHFLMAAVMRQLQPDRDGERAFETLFVLRAIGWFIALTGALAHHFLARRLLGPLGAAVASLLLWSTLIAFEKTIEIRPDTPAFALLQIALLVCCGESSWRRTAVAFSLMGIGLLFTQKLLFPILGAIVAVGLVLPKGLMARVRELSVIALGLLAPTALCAAYFLANGGLPAFIEDVFLINLRWKARFEAWPFFVSRFLEPNPFFAVLGGAGIIQGIFSLRAPSNPGEGRGERIVLCSAASGVLGLALLPVAWEQYYLLFLPQAAILGSGALLRLLAALLRQAPGSGRVALAVLGLNLASLSTVREAILNQRLRTGEAKERSIAMILDNSLPTDTVLDGYSGIGVFRPHAFRYFFLHAEMRLMLDERAVRELEEGLERGIIAPRFASGDSQLRAVSPLVRDFLERNFSPVGDGPVEVRVFPGGEVGWDDASLRFPGQLPPARGAYVLSVFGWHARQSIGGRTFRRSRGKTSTMLFPVLHPDDFGGLLLSARAGAAVPGLSATVRLNGNDLGELALGPVFTTFERPIGAGILVRGLNRLEFSYPRRPAQTNPALSADENSALALESLGLKAGGVDSGAPRPSGVRLNRDE